MIRLLPVLLLFAAHAHAMVIDPVDPAYGVAITEIARLPNGATADVRGIAALPGGRVALLTSQGEQGGSCYDANIFVFTADGRADVAFGVQGRASAASLGLTCLGGAAAGFAAGPDGAFYIVGYLRDAATGELSLPRVWKATPTGTAETSFGSAGSAPIPGVRFVRWRTTVRILAGGIIAVGGTVHVVDALGNESIALGVARLLPSGAPDAGYGTQGVALATAPGRPIYAQDGGGMAVNADGSTLVAGNIFEDDAGAKIYTDAAVVRFDPAGRVDASYGDAGFAIPMRDASTYAQSMYVVDGVAYLAGVQSRDTPYAFLARIDARGRTDLAWGNAGIAGTDRFRESNFDPQVVVDAHSRAYFVVTDWSGRPHVHRFDASGRLDAEFGLDGAAFVAVEGWTFAGAPLLALGADDAVFLGAGAFFALDDATRTALGVTRLSASGGHRAGVTGGTAVIYYNRGLDHYFLTANPAEQALLDSGATVGWDRTGEQFRVVMTTPQDPELTPVCRYYGRPEAHLDSHFFSAAPDECAAVAAKFGASWILETDAAFFVHPADRIGGQCPRGSERVYRAFDNRADANHWYGILPNKPGGWIYEGYGPEVRPTAFCAPLL